MLFFPPFISHKDINQEPKPQPHLFDGWLKQTWLKDQEDYTLIFLIWLSQGNKNKKVFIESCFPEVPPLTHRRPVKDLEDK